jgi:hypothetical protein
MVDLWRDVGAAAHKTEVVDHRMRGEAQLSGDAQSLGLRFHAAF